MQQQRQLNAKRFSIAGASCRRAWRGGDSIFHICKNAEDADDVVQDTFLQYHISEKCFEDEQHIRAWLLRVAINRAKDINRSFWRRNRVSLDEYTETLPFESPESENLFAQVMKLPEKQRIIIHLYHYEKKSTSHNAPESGDSVVDLPRKARKRAFLPTSHTMRITRFGKLRKY